MASVPRVNIRRCTVVEVNIAIGVRAGGTGRAAALPPPSFGNVTRERKLKEKRPFPPQKKREMKQRLSFPNVRLTAHMPASVEWRCVASIKCHQLVIPLVNERCWRTCRLHSSIHSLPTFIPSCNLSDLLIRVWLCDNENTENNRIFFVHEKIRVVVTQQPEIENRFSGNDHDVLCALGDITLGDPPTSDSFNLVARYYNLVRELLQAEQGLFS